MGKKLGAKIKEARTAAGLTQEQLARKVTGLTASDISKAERGELEPSQAQLKAIAGATGVTQKSLLDLASKSSAKKTSSGKTSSGSSSSDSQKLTESEKKLLRLYRKASASKKKSVMELLEKEESDLENLLGQLLGGGSGKEDLLGNLLGGGSGSGSGKKRKASEIFWKEP